MSEPTAPQVGDRNVKAQTTTRTQQVTTLAEITAVEAEVATFGGLSGWFVWGYPKRKTNRSRQTCFPRLYFIPNEETE